jgi:hypothetical protein
MFFKMVALGGGLSVNVEAIIAIQKGDDSSAKLIMFGGQQVLINPAQGKLLDEHLAEHSREDAPVADPQQAAQPSTAPDGEGQQAAGQEGTAQG